MIELNLTDTDVHHLRVLMDAGLRHLGLDAAMPAAILNQKIASAVEQSKKTNVVPMPGAAAG